MSDFIGDKECVTHHYACACREAMFEKQREEFDALRADAEKLVEVLKSISEQEYHTCLGKYLVPYTCTCDIAVADQAIADFEKKWRKDDA